MFLSVVRKTSNGQEVAVLQRVPVLLRGRAHGVADQKRANRDRGGLIRARRETVFRFFTDPARWASWWGQGSTIDPRPGGRVIIRYSTAVEARGEVIEIAPPERLTFTYGYASGTPIAPGASLVSIRLEVDCADTRLHLTHDFSDAAARDEHVQGWRYQLSLFANVVSNDIHADATAIIDAWLAAWSQADASACKVTLSRIAESGVRFRDRFSIVDGLDDLISTSTRRSVSCPACR